jgi:hypothetical protein
MSRQGVTLRGGAFLARDFSVRCLQIVGGNLA